jgi:catechol 2,3-dioxygenase-like lactoylglutathione lyase family enzyme
VRSPPEVTTFAHVSLPTVNLEEGVRFYTELLGREADVLRCAPNAAVNIAGIQFGRGTDGCSFVQPRMEYSHIASTFSGRHAANAQVALALRRADD